MQDHEYTRPTHKSGYRYLFTSKHHGGGSRTDAQWLLSLSEDNEFAVFEGADALDLNDEDGNLYGALPEGENSLRCLGTNGQQLAFFPLASTGSPWHGYPLWPTNQDAARNRRGEKQRPSKEVFARMVEAGLITPEMQQRLWKGDLV